MVQGKWFPAGADLTVPLALRRVVFGLSGDALDEWAQQVAVYEDPETPVGAARLRWSDGAFVMELVGVLPEKRRHGYGDLLVRLCLFKALTHNGREVRLLCPQELVPFFAKYGFEAAEPLADGSVPMNIPAESIHLDSCNGHCDGCR